MLNRCFGCCPLMGRTVPRWEAHLEAFCRSRGQKCPWTRLLLENMDLIREQGANAKAMEAEVRSTNIASEIVKAITSHYKDGENPFRVCVELFGSYLKVRYADKVTPSRQALLRLQEEYLSFCELMGDMLVLFYGLEERQIIGEEVFYKTTLPSLVAGLLFDNNDVSSTILFTVKGANSHTAQRIAVNLRRVQQFSIDHFAPSLPYRLNQQTLHMYHKSGTTVDTPYSGVTQVLLQTVRIPSPAEKMQLLEGLLKQVEQAVFNFHKKNGIEASVELGKSDLQAILLYSIVQSRQATVFLHFTIAELFVPQKVSTHHSECFQCLKAAFAQLEKGSITPEYEMPHGDEDETSHTRSYFDEVTSSLEL